MQNLLNPIIYPITPIMPIYAYNITGSTFNIALIVLFGIATFFGYTLAGSFSDLKIWATWCLVNVILAIVSLVKQK